MVLGTTQSVLLNDFLRLSVEKKASDIHFRVGQPPLCRIDSVMTQVGSAALTEIQMHDLYATLASQLKDAPSVQSLQDFDCAYDLPGIARFRCNVFRNQGHLGMAFRLIRGHIPTISELGLSPVLAKIAESERGLILVTGATGSGKSTTLAAMIDHVNSTQSSHILTIEDPIEFLHPQKQSCITQREVGGDTKSFSIALRAALRQDPDVILVGEMRDIETVDVALKAAETGHTVFSTVHTTDVLKTIGRLVSMFPAAEQKAVRMRFADNIRAIISQRILVRADAPGRVVAQEIMISHVGIQECIADPGKSGEILSYMEQGFEGLGSQTFDQNLMGLYREGKISLEVAMGAAASAADFENKVLFTKNTSSQTQVEKSVVSLKTEDSTPVGVSFLAKLKKTGS